MAIDVLTLSLAKKYTDKTLTGSGAMKGEKGDKGERGEQGEQGIQGEAGADGKSAYEIAKENGFAGTEEEFAQALTERSNCFIDVEEELPDVEAADTKAIYRVHINSYSTIEKKDGLKWVDFGNTTKDNELLQMYLVPAKSGCKFTEWGFEDENNLQNNKPYGQELLAAINTRPNDFFVNGLMLNMVPQYPNIFSEIKNCALLKTTNGALPFIEIQFADDKVRIANVNSYYEYYAVANGAWQKLSGREIAIALHVDGVMSDVSGNAVQNKVVKQYVDEKVANMQATDLTEIEERLETLENNSGSAVDSYSKTESDDKYATKDEIADFITEDSLNNLATKTELENLATKQELQEISDIVDEKADNSKIGNLNQLRTTTTDSLVNAINSVQDYTDLLSTGTSALRDKVENDYATKQELQNAIDNVAVVQPKLDPNGGLVENEHGLGVKPQISEKHTVKAVDVFTGTNKATGGTINWTRWGNIVHVGYSGLTFEGTTWRDTTSIAFLPKAVISSQFSCYNISNPQALTGDGNVQGDGKLHLRPLGTNALTGTMIYICQD